jgi:hypothetical protein
MAGEAGAGSGTAGALCATPDAGGKVARAVSGWWASQASAARTVTLKIPSQVEVFMEFSRVQDKLS